MCDSVMQGGWNDISIGGLTFSVSAVGYTDGLAVRAMHMCVHVCM